MRESISNGSTESMLHDDPDRMDLTVAFNGEGDIAAVLKFDDEEFARSEISVFSPQVRRWLMMQGWTPPQGLPASDAEN